MVLGVTGQTGLTVLRNVRRDIRIEQGHVITQLLLMASNVMELVRVRRVVMNTLVLLMVTGQSGRIMGYAMSHAVEVYSKE